MAMTTAHWISILRWFVRVSGKEHLFIKHTWSSFYYVDRKRAFGVAPESLDDRTMTDAIPKVYRWEGEMPVEIPDSEEKQEIARKFHEFQVKRNFFL